MKCIGKDFSDINEDNFAFLAPEIANLDPYDKKADYYSAGVIFSMMLGNRHPYFHLLINNDFDRFVNRLNYCKQDERNPRYPMIFDNIPYKLTRFIHHLIIMDPKKRYSTIRDKKGYLILNFEYKKFFEKKKNATNQIVFNDENTIRELQTLSKIVVYRK